MPILCKSSPGFVISRLQLCLMNEADRIMAEGKLESMKCECPGVWSNLFAGAFGLASVLIGLALAFLILWAIFLA